MSRVAGAVLMSVGLLALAAPAAEAAPAAKHKHRHAAHHKHHPKKKHHAKAKKKAPAATDAPANATVSLPVAFAVRNTNTSNIPCTSDGAAYTVHGHVTGPANGLASGKAATLYAHGLGYGEFFWTYSGVPGYDYAAEQADAGHVSVTIDRLGYGASKGPDGNAVCLGSQADVLHQIVQELRSGSYTLSGGTPVSYQRVGTVGHSAGGYVVESEAASYHDVDDVVVASFANTGPSPLALSQLAEAQVACHTSPSPTNTAPFGATDADFAAAHFYDIDPAVAADVLKIRSQDPCGDTASALAASGIGATSDMGIKVPVLLIYGANDALFPPPAGDEEKALFGNNPVSEEVLADTGHAVTLGRSAPAFRAAMGRWLSDHGF